ncbi:MAG: PAS domain-containing sensor histidine kinase [Actinomycetota bacterium]|nr:PAS domain-containing sensor histidine kinase [Actinomycetota bacterium]
MPGTPDLAYRPAHLRARSPWQMSLLSGVAFAVAVDIAHATSHLATHRTGPIPSIWLLSPTMLVWASTVWMWPPRFRVQAAVATALAALVVYVDISLILGGGPILDLLRLGVGNVLQGFIAVVAYRAIARAHPDSPRTGGDLIALLGAGTVAALAVIPIGATAGVHLSSPGQVLLWWVLEASAFSFFGSACLLTLWNRNPRHEVAATRAFEVFLQLVLGGTCVFAIFTWPQQQLSWTLLIPAVWVGTTLGPWFAAAYSATVVTAAYAVGALPHHQFRGSSWLLPPSLVLDLLVGAFVLVTLLLSFMHSQRVHVREADTQRRQYADEQAGLLQVVFESMSEGVLLIDSSHKLVLHNQAARRILGREMLETGPADWSSLVKPVDPQGGDAPPDLCALDRDGPWSMAFHVPGNTGSDGAQTILVDASVINHDGESNTVLIVRNITSERQRIEELANFAGVAAHDLKSPLTAVQGWLEMAGDALGTDPGTARTALTRGMAASNRMAREIDDWLAFNVVRDGEIRHEQVVVDDIVRELAPTYPSATFNLDAPHRLSADGTLTRQLLANLVGNAVKYTRPGEAPEITLTSEPAAEEGWVQVTVADHGIGIPEGEEEAIFEPFRRASTVAKGYDGSGLGLALCKRIVQRHGGEIVARSNVASGSSISFTLPAG